MFIQPCFPSLYKRLIGLSIALMSFIPSKASPPPPINTGDVYITIKNSSLSVSKLFGLIQQQSPVVFAYDETEVNLSQKVTLKTGTQLLDILLESISLQTDLSFTQKQNSILVSSKKDLPVKGTVKDPSGNPLNGATITVKGTTTSVITDADGNFSINVPENAVLIISYVGYRTQEIPVNNRSEISVALEDTDAKMNELIVVGYQTQRRGEITGAVSTVNVAGLSKLPVGTVDQALQGKVSGVRITQHTGQPGEGVASKNKGSRNDQ